MLNTAYILYIIALIFAPTALGATHLWATLTVESLIFVAFFLVLFTAYRNGTQLRYIPALVPALGYVFWIAVQLVPLPSALLAWISPHTYAIYASVHPPSATSFWAPLTLKPQFTAQELLRFASFICVYFLTIQLLWQRKRLKQTLNILLAVVGFLAFVAIIQCFSGSEKIFWFIDPGPHAFFGPFFYRNHFAGFMAMILPLCMSIFLYYRPQGGSGIPFRQQIIHVLDQLKQSPSFRYGLTALLLFASILLSQSRTGISVAVITTGSMLLWSRKLFRLNRTSPALILLLLLLAILLVGRTGFDKIDARFGETINKDGLSATGKSFNGRTTPWQDCLDLFADFPITGTGMGTFYAIYPSYKTTESPNPLRQAHNEYVETATDGGLIACLLIATFFILFARKNYGMYCLRRDTYAKHIYIGGCTGIIALLLHSITDYQFHQTAANPLYFFTLLGVQTVAIHSRRETTDKSSLLPLFTLKAPVAFVSFAVLIFLTIATLLLNGGAMKALNLYKNTESINNLLINLSPDTNNEELLNARIVALRAADFDPLNPVYFTASAYLAQHLDLLDEADHEYRRALYLDPVNANTLQLFGVFLSEIEGGDNEAEKIFEASVLRDKKSKQRLLFYVYWLIGQQKFDQALPTARVMLDQYPELTPSFLSTLQSVPLPPDIMPKILPERVEPYLAYAAMLEEKGDIEGAAATYDLALSFMEREVNAKPKYFTQPLAFFRKQKDEDRLLAVLKTAVTRLPNEFSFHLQLGDTYLRQGMHRKAAEEFRMALQLRPGNREVQQRLESVMVE